MLDTLYAIAFAWLAINCDLDLVFELVWAFSLVWGCGYCWQAEQVDLWELPLPVPHSESVVL